MEDMFYIICVNEKEDWWQLRLKGSHLVIACNYTKDTILECLYKIVVRYGRPRNLRNAISRMEMYNEGKVNMEQYQAEYLEVGHLYSEEIEETVRRAEQTIRKERKENSPLAKTNRKLRSICKPDKSKCLVEEAPTKAPIEVTTEPIEVKKRLPRLKPTRKLH